MTRTTTVWTHLVSHRRRITGAVLALALLFVYIAGLLMFVAEAGKSDDPAAPAAMLGLWIAGLWFLQEYIFRMICMLLGLAWFDKVFPEPEASQ